MYKLIVSNFDKTLINDYEEIPASTIILLDELRRKGIKFAVATERSINSLLYYNRDFPFIDYLITSNGSYIYDLNKEKVIFKKNISIRDLKKIIKTFYNKANIYLTNNNNVSLISKENINIEDYVKIDDIDKFIEENKTNIYKIELYFKDKLSTKKALADIKLLNLNINANIKINGDKLYIEITNLLVSKANGLEIIVKKQKIDIKDVISFGSDETDIELIEKSGCGVAVNNACEKLKNIADHTTLDNNSKGVEDYLRKIYK